MPRDRPERHCCTSHVNAPLIKAGVTAKIMVGGTPVTQTCAEKIGAHGYAPDGASAVDTAKSLVA